MTGALLVLLLFFFCGNARAQIVTPISAAPAQAAVNVPNGTPPQVLGWSAPNTPEAETIVGDMTLSRTGVNQYTATVLTLSGTPVGNLATLNVGSGFSTVGGSLNLSVPIPVTSGGAGSSTAASTGAIRIAQSATDYEPKILSGDATVSVAGVVSVTKVAGNTPGGSCSANNYVTSIDSSGRPTCSPVSGNGMPNGNTPQIVGYSGINTGEAWTVSGGAGNCTYARTGANAATLTCSGYAPLASPTFTGTVTMPDAGTWTSSGITSTAATFSGNVGAATVNAANFQINSGTGSLKAANGAIYYQPGYSLPTYPATWDINGLNNFEGLGIGQAVGTDPIDITDNIAGPSWIYALNNNAAGTALAGVKLSNGTNAASFAMMGTSASNPEGGANTAVLHSDQGLNLAANTGQPIKFEINGTVVGNFAANGLHLTTPLEVYSGGTGTATAPAQNQILVAQSATAYAPVTLAGDLSITSTGTATVNKIQGYPTGTAIAWTPYFANIGTGTAITATYTTQDGFYVQIGKIVIWTIHLMWSSFSGGSGNTVIRGFPLTLASAGGTMPGISGAATYGGITYSSGTGGIPGMTELACQMSGNMIILGASGSGQAGNLSLSYSNFGNTGAIYCSGIGSL